MAEVIIVGAGLAGLSCARELARANIPCLIVEASDGVGGRARTDYLGGFLLDRGFQVLLTAYPEAQRSLDYTALQLGRFEPGALVRLSGKFHRVADPWRRPGAMLQTAFSPIGTLGDKLRIAKLRYQVTRGPLQAIFQSPETSTSQFLRERGFSPVMIERFFRPFFGGIFLESELRTSSRMFQFVFRMFSEGHAALPARGMGAMAEQMASRLPEGTIRLNARATQVAAQSVTLATGERLSARSVVIAADHANACRLVPSMPQMRSKGATCLYFAAEKTPIDEPTLVLNGDSSGPVNSVCVPNLVAAGYAPVGAHLVSVTVLGQREMADGQMQAAVRQQLTSWFGPAVQRWQHLKSYFIPDALPEQTSVVLRDGSARLPEGSYACGDFLDTASINGALRSGRQVAEALLADARA